MSYKGIDTAIGDEDMATGRHGKISDFRRVIDSVGLYKERFLFYCVANIISKDGDKSKAVFLTCIEATTYNLLENLSPTSKATRPAFGQIARLTTEAL